MTRVLLIAKGYRPDIGGLETYSEEVALAYARLGAEVTVLTAHSGSRGEEVSRGVRVINVSTGPQPLVFAWMVRNLLKLVGTQAFDLVHATSWRVALPPLLLRIGTPIIVTVHGREVLAAPKALTPIMHYVFRRVSGVVAVSQPILETFQARLPFALMHTAIAWNGISYEERARHHAPNPDFAQIFSLCRLVERKNIPAAVRAVGLLEREGYQLRYTIGGTGPESGLIDATIHEEGVMPSVNRRGYIDDDEVVALYKRCGIFLHPQVAAKGGSDIEGFGISIADAMSFGAVAVAGANGGPQDFIVDGNTGLLIDGDSKEAIAGAIRQLLSEPERTKGIAARGREFALDRLSWNRHVAEVLALARSVRSVRLPEESRVKPGPLGR